jgi:DNA-binding XRE family transcriptional regulator
MTVPEAAATFSVDSPVETDGLLEPVRFVTSAPMTAEEFKALRTSLGLSQRELAKILGVVHVTIIRAEKRGPTREVESLLALALSQGRLQIKPKDEKPGRRRRKNSSGG